MACPSSSSPPTIGRSPLESSRPGTSSGSIRRARCPSCVRSPAWGCTTSWCTGRTTGGGCPLAGEGAGAARGTKGRPGTTPPSRATNSSAGVASRAPSRRRRDDRVSIDGRRHAWVDGATGTRCDSSASCRKMSVRWSRTNGAGSRYQALSGSGVQRGRRGARRPVDQRRPPNPMPRQAPQAIGPPARHPCHLRTANLPCHS